MIIPITNKKNVCIVLISDYVGNTFRISVQDKIRMNLVSKKFEDFLRGPTQSRVFKKCYRRPLPEFANLTMTVKGQLSTA
jgi:hypothetical protein